MFSAYIPVIHCLESIKLISLQTTNIQNIGSEYPEHRRMIYISMSNLTDKTPNSNSQNISGHIFQEMQASFAMSRKV